MDTNDTLIQLLKNVERLSTQFDTMDTRLLKIENVVNNDIRQDQRLSSIETSLQRGNAKFQKIEDRLNALEDAEGNKAKRLVNQVVSYLITAVLGFAVSAVMFYLANGGK